MGPTASGKTGLSIEVAKHFGAPVVSCDSRQFYREIPVGTAAPTPEEQDGVAHYFVGNRSVTEFYNAGRYEEDALRLLDELFLSYDRVVMVGGSGLYIDAVCEGMDDIPAVDPSIRPALQERFEQEGLDSLLTELQERDPEYHAQVDRQNPARVIRALEICRGTGKTYTELRKGTAKARPFDILKIGVNLPREELYDRINRRVELMLEAGLESEARGVYPLREHNALQTVGFREFFSYFDGEISRDEAIELIKRNSRRYAKRQLTWFGRDEKTAWFTKDDTDKVIQYIKAHQ
ncbi:tRNA (adenosine(37)-N6)-dimethylallyltransferase MiaA [Alistipes sp. OttesenSCG-928-L06]|nr:tRNA (adenosine(37)-N6)-dimethylallyltransferase MiaA [Alistipes sp. OttesenSCG-928-L06]